MSSRRAGVVLLLLVALLASLLVVSGFSPPPVYEHKAERNHRGTQCEACQAVVKQALRRMPKGYSEPDLSTQKLRRAREQKVGRGGTHTWTDRREGAAHTRVAVQHVDSHTLHCPVSVPCWSLGERRCGEPLHHRLFRPL